jgi:alkylation response protein AidB-like acyl-CoA dehydrogenase
MVTFAAAPTSVLTEHLLERCAERAATHDRENRFFTEDFEELRQAGYLLSAVPQQFGGRRLSLADVCQEQRRLAYPLSGHGSGHQYAPVLDWSCR